MGLFGNSSAKDEVRQVVRARLMQSEVLPMIIDTIAYEAGKKPEIIINEDGTEEKYYSSENRWLVYCNNYYDSGIRTLYVEPDTVGIKWSVMEPTVSNASGSNVTLMKEVIIREVKYSYTSAGYVPLHKYDAPNGVLFGINEVLEEWCEIISDRLKGSHARNIIYSTAEKGEEYRQVL